VEKLPAVKEHEPAGLHEALLHLVLTRASTCTFRPERVYFWPGLRRDAQESHSIWDAHMEEVRSGPRRGAGVEPPAPVGGASAWDQRIEELGRLAQVGGAVVRGGPTAPVLRAPAHEGGARPRGLIRLDAEPVGVPARAPALGCITAHDPRRALHHLPAATSRCAATWFSARAAWVAMGHWLLAPHKLVGGFELPPGSLVQRLRLNYGTTEDANASARSPQRELERRAQRTA